jgi:phenylpropionate dioxygenase-like ring-hydroxylating dioxygenase large terminal subunit
MSQDIKFPPGWYVIGRTQEFSTRKLNAIRRFGLDWVVRRNRKGDWIAHEDRCPHRSAKLSLGSITDDCVSCPFHGFRFDSSGACAWVPEIGRDAPGLRIRTHPLMQKHGFLWIGLGEPKGQIPWFEELRDSAFSYSWSVHEWAQHFTRCVENQLDYSHLPFVHRTTIGRGFDPTFKAPVRINDQGIRVSLDSKRDPSAYFEFQFGNIWKLNISDKMKQVIAFVPVDAGRTRIYLRTYHSFVRLPVLRTLIAWLLAPFNFLVLHQDHRVVMSQEPKDVSAATHEKLFPSDRAIRAFRRWWLGEDPNENAGSS